MILSCPECSTRFMVPDDALRPSGRKVKCGKCAHQWFADPPPSLDQIAAEDGGDAGAGHDYEAVRVTPLDPEEQAIYRPRNLPAVAGPAPRMAGAVAWGLLVVMVAVLGSILWFGRVQIVTALPMVQPLYTSVGLCVGVADPEASFSFASKPQPSRAESGDLVISGELQRDSDCATYVPEIVVEFLDTDRKVLQRSVYPLNTGPLALGEATPFALTIADWPENIADVNLLFTIPNVQG